ncbi:MAG TPA: glycosyltransferase [Chitinophagaceae bacterium]|nr:glycosyltransferase [Chitinophagaceae bacterium]
MTRKKILWLCSWYPGKTEPFNGDFIQRHARAAALYNDIYVIHAIETDSVKIKETTGEISQSAGLTEKLIYIKRKNSWWSRMMGHYRWLSMFRQAIRDYIRENGKPDLVHVNVPMKAGLFALWMKSKYGTRFIVTEHWGIYNDVERLNYTGRSETFKHYTKKIFDKAVKFISVSRYLGEGVNRMVIPKEFEIVPNVTDTDLFFYKERSATPFRFIHVSNMVALKNAEGILEAFQSLQGKYKDVELIMVGDTDPGIRDHAKRIGLQPGSVFFKGEVPYEQVARQMQGSDCFILFSNIENSPCVIGEALCCGLPVIASRVGGVPELLDERNSLLIEKGDTAALTATMEKVISGRTNYNHKKIAEDARGKFSYMVIGKKLDEIYSGVIATS